MIDAIAIEALDVAEQAAGEVNAVRAAVAERWVIDHLDDQSVWLRPSVLKVARAVRNHAYNDIAEDRQYQVAKSGRVWKEKDEDALAAEAEAVETAFLGYVVRTAAAAVTSKEGFEFWKASCVAVEVEGAKFEADLEFPAFRWRTRYFEAGSSRS